MLSVQAEAYVGTVPVTTGTEADVMARLCTLRLYTMAGVSVTTLELS